MRSLFFVAVAYCYCSMLFGQLPEVYLNNKQTQALGVMSTTATLVVVIENEKNEDDAALINAVKTHWHIGPVKYMSGLEFSEKYKAHLLNPANLYLFNNHTNNLTYNGRMVVTMNPGKLSKIPALYSGYYLTNQPYQLVNSLKYEKAPPFLFFSSAVLKDQKLNPISGFYSLMIKNFNHDVLYCQDAQNFNKKKKKNKRKNGIYFFTTDKLDTKTILLVKEQTSQTTKKEKEEKVKREQQQSAKKKQKLSSDVYVVKDKVVVFPEDIGHAVKKNDGDILLISGDCLYSALDGSVYATTRGHSSGGLAVVSYLSLVMSIAAIAAFLVMTRN